MKIKFLGAAGTVTGSSYVLTSESGQAILIDLGMFQGTTEIEALNYEKYDYDCKNLSAVLLTHAHLDHCGRLPILVKNSFNGSIYMTAPTAELTELSLLDSAKIAKFDRVHALYDEVLALKTIRKFSKVGYHTPLRIGDFVITFYDAGHILGSASLEIVDESAQGEIKKVVFSGDLGNTPEELVRPTEYLPSADLVIMESTYGDRLHPSENPVDIIQSEINKIEENGSTLLIPAFSMERSQELLHVIKHLKANGKVRIGTPVYLDGPMAEKATAVYLDYPQLFNDHIQAEMKAEGPFSFPGLYVTKNSHDSELIRARRGPQVVIAGSGMMTGGRIVSHAAHFLTNESTRLLIVGYQGEETLGRELLEGKKELIIDDVPTTIRAQINSTQAMSSHADQGQLIEWLGHIQGVKKVVLTHGEDEPRKVLSEKIKTNLDISDIQLPQQNQELNF